MCGVSCSICSLNAFRCRQPSLRAPAKHMLMFVRGGKPRSYNGAHDHHIERLNCPLVIKQMSDEGTAFRLLFLSFMLVHNKSSIFRRYGYHMSLCIVGDSRLDEGGS